jgi:hypothetical protein
MHDTAKKAELRKTPTPAMPIPHLEEFCQQIGIGKAGRKLLDASLTPWGFFGRLLANEKFPDAIRFLAHTLPKREAVWWGCLCLRMVAGPNLGPKQTQAFQSAVRWVLDPNQANCQAAEAAGRAAGFATPAGCLAMSVFWTGKSLTPPNQPAVPPDPLLTANTLTGVILMAATEGEPGNTPKNQRQFLSMGISVANRELLWAER